MRLNTTYTILNMLDQQPDIARIIQNHRWPISVNHYQAMVDQLRVRSLALAMGKDSAAMTIAFVDST